MDEELIYIFSSQCKLTWIVIVIPGLECRLKSSYSSESLLRKIFSSFRSGRLMWNRLFKSKKMSLSTPCLEIVFQPLPTLLKRMHLQPVYTLPFLLYISPFSRVLSNNISLTPSFLFPFNQQFLHIFVNQLSFSLSLCLYVSKPL